MTLEAIKKVGVIGCGTMGAGIAVCCLRAGYRVTALEINEELLQKKSLREYRSAQASLARAASRLRVRSRWDGT